jgi:hypothetical protein
MRNLPGGPIKPSPLTQFCHDYRRQFGSCLPRGAWGTAETPAGFSLPPGSLFICATIKGDIIQVVIFATLVAIVVVTFVFG